MQGLMELKNKIMDLALSQPYMPDTIPLVFLSLEEKIGGTDCLFLDPFIKLPSPC
jgi:hypothetical protein